MDPKSTAKTRKIVATVSVTSRQPSRMRIGQTFTGEPTVIEVSEEELDALKADPQLVVADAPKEAKKA